MKKKLLITAYNLGIGGIETALLAMLSSIDYSKYDVTLVLERKEGINLEKISSKVHVREYKLSNCKIPIVRKVLNRLKLIKEIITNYNKYDFACSYAPYCIPGCIIARYASKNNYIWVHSDYHYLYKKDLKKIKGFFDKRRISSFKHIVFVTNEARDHFVKIYPSLINKCLLCNNIIDYKSIIKKSKIKIDEEKPKRPLLLNVSRHEEHAKKLTRLIEASKRLIEEGYNFEIWMIGTGDDTKLYEDLIKKLKLEDHIKMLGLRQNPYPYYKKADAFILTSDYEGFPVVYLESMIFDLPIITTIDVSYNNLQIRDSFGIVTEKNLESLYQGMKLFLDHGYISKKKFDPRDHNKIVIGTLEKMFNNKL